MRPKLPLLKLTLLLTAMAIVSHLALSFILPRLIDLNSYKAQLTEILQNELKRSISLGESSFSWKLGPVFTFSQLVIMEPDGKETFATAKQVSLTPALLPLLRKKVVLSEIDLVNPVISISRDTSGKLSIDDLLKPAPGKSAPKLGELRIHKGTLFWKDSAAEKGKTVSVSMSDIELDLDQLEPGEKSSFRLSLQLDEGKSGKISGSGSIRLPKQGADLLTASLNATAKLSKVDYNLFWPYAAHLVPFPSPGGTASMNLTLKGGWNKLSSSGDLRLHQPKVVWPKVFSYTVAPDQAQLVFELKKTTDRIEIPKVHITLDGFAFRGGFSLSDMKTADPLLHATGVSDNFDFAKVKSYIPFGIIDDDVADFIDNKIKSGRFKLNSGTLDARISQLAKFGIDDNANTLFISGTAEDAVISYGGTSPSFNRIKTELELKGRNFNLHKASAYFGNSPFTLQNASITEYATEGVPSEYLFTMDAVPGPAEVAWLASFVQLDKLAFGGPSTLRLTGSGPVKAYQLSGAWQLTQAWYEFEPAVKKPAGMASALSFSSVLSKNETKLTSISYSLPPMQLSASGLFRHDDDNPHLSFELQSNTFALTPRLPVLNNLRDYQLNGMVQLHLLGSGNPEDFSAMKYSGTIKLADTSVKPLTDFDPIKAINGTITFKGSSVQTSRIAVKYGTTPLTIRGRIVNLSAPEAELLISSPQLNPVDFGLSGAEIPQVRQFSTHLAFKDDTLHIRALTGKLDKSHITATGTYSQQPKPELILNISAPHLDIEELLPLLAPAQPEPPLAAGAQVAPNLHLAGRITAKQGRYGNAEFKKLAVNFQNDGGALQLHSLEAEIFEGRLNASGQLVRHKDKPSDWDLNIKLDKARSGDLLAALELNREIRGLMSASGVLQAKGDTLAEVKQSVSGDLRLEIGRGVLRRFNSLSKVFSILNVSQILTFRLPDMASDGMPFNSITASIHLKEGILTTKDFFIDSNAMHVSMVGKADIVNENLDLLIGVQPLQIVDKIISRIPVVGWILTGGDNNLISTYFEAKGSWEDPQVKAIPVSSMAKGTLGIFQRIFELPVRIFTDTGEVLFGIGKEDETPEKEPGKSAPKK